jgi:hypothetical protein
MNLVLIDDTTEPIQDIRYIQEQLGYGSVHQFDHLKGLPILQLDSEKPLL